MSLGRDGAAGPAPPRAQVPAAVSAGTDGGPPSARRAGRESTRVASPPPPSRRRRPEAFRPAVPPGIRPAHADWRALAARAQYREALASAVDELHGEGWAAGCARLGADDVVLLGDVARLAGDLTRADEAYQSARPRFPSAD